MSQLTLDLSPSVLPALDNFVPGRNVEVVQALRYLLASDANNHRERCVYLWGAAGAGKTHLLQAMVYAMTQHPSTAAHFIACPPADHFAAQLDAPGAESATSACVAVDAVERLDADGQIALFHLYNRLRENLHSVLLVSGTLPPAQLTLREDLKTRLGWGLVYEVHALTDFDKIAALAHRAKLRGFDLPPEVSDYLLRHVARDMPALLAILDRLDRQSLSQHRKITVPLVRALLSNA